jgi:hypothetical protein
VSILNITRKDKKKEDFKKKMSIGVRHQNSSASQPFYNFLHPYFSLKSLAEPLTFLIGKKDKGIVTTVVCPGIWLQYPGHIKIVKRIKQYFVQFVKIQ